MTFSSTRRCVSFLVLALIVIAACSEPIESREPASVAQDQSAAVEGTAGTVLAASPTFVVKDQSGNAIGGVKVSIAVTAGGGTLTNAPTMSGDGPTSIGTWKLGDIAGVNSLTITVAGLTPLVISVTGRPGPPASVVFVSGANQSAPAGVVLPVSPVAQVRDQFGNGVAGVSVTFSVVDGEGFLNSAAPVTTNATGNAAAPQWTLGKSAIPQGLRATAGSFSAVTHASIASDYHIEVKFFGPPMPPVAGAMFTAAAARIRGAVTGDLPDISFPLTDLTSSTTGCGVADLPESFSEIVDDVVVFASVGSIDGAGNVLAFAFPCFIRQPFPARQTVLGVMKFDSEDIDNLIARGNLTDVIQHEMLHVVGVGTLWRFFSLVAGAGTAETRYTGAMGVGGCVAIGGGSVCPSSVPLENTGGSGTIDSHWRESVFFNELMTGFVNSRISVPVGLLNPMSVMTIQSLADVGYTVNSMAADPYTLPTPTASRILGELSVGEAAQAWERVEQPKFEISRGGHKTRIPVAK